VRGSSLQWSLSLTSAFKERWGSSEEKGRRRQNSETMEVSLGRKKKQQFKTSHMVSGGGAKEAEGKEDIRF